MKLPVQGRLMLLLLLSSCVSSLPGFAQLVDTAIPKKMRLCVNGGCENLIWFGDHYEGRHDGDATLISRYWVKTWSPDLVEFTGKSVKTIDGANFVEGNFSGNIDPAGEGLLSAHVDWKIGPSQSGRLPFILVWTPSKENTAQAKTLFRPKPKMPVIKPEPVVVADPDDADISAVMPRHRSKNNPDILIPAGSSEIYASWPDDVRAMLRGEHSLTVRDSKRWCDDVKENSKVGFVEGAADPAVTDPQLALDIGRFALRTGDFVRGHCWVGRSGDLGTGRAKVMMGVIYMMGWYGPKNPELAFRYFSGEYRSKDYWAVHFLEKCFEEGIGTPVNKEKGAQVMMALMVVQDADKYEETIGQDDIGKARRDEIYDLKANPPKTLNYCNDRTASEVARRMPAQCFYNIQYDELQRKIDAVNAKYAAIK